MTTINICLKGQILMVMKEDEQNKQPADELYKAIIRISKKRRVYSSFKDNIWGADLAYMQLISKYNKDIRFALCVIDICSKHACAIPLKNKKGATTINTFQSILDSLERKPKEIWLDQGSELYKKSFKKWLDDNDIKMFKLHNRGKSVVAERFIRTMKNKMYKRMTAVSKNIKRINKFENAFTYQKLAPIEHLRIHKFTVLLHV